MDEKIKVESLNNIFFELKLVFRYLLSKWISILVIAFLFAALGLTYGLLKTTKFSAKTTFISETGGEDKLGGYASIAAQFGIGIGGMNNGSLFEGDNLMEVFKSRKIIVKTLLNPYDNDTTVLMIDKYIENHKIKLQPKIDNKEQKSIFINVDEKTNRYKDSIITNIYDYIIKSQLLIDKYDKKLDIITMGFDDVNEDFALKFSQKLTENAIKFYSNYKSKKAKANVDILQHRADTLREILNNNIYNVASINDLNVNPNKQILRVEPQKKQIDLQVTSSIYTEVLKQLEIAQLSLRKETPLIQIIDEPILPLKKAGMGKLTLMIVFGLVGFLISALYFIMTRILKQ